MNASAQFPEPEAPRREPMFNLPGVILGLIAVFVIVHAYRLFFLGREEEIDFLLRFAFIPARYGMEEVAGFPLPGGVAADFWTPLSYAFLHGDWMHLGVNALWMAAFGSAVAFRFGTGRFLLFSALCAAAGAGVFYLFNAGEFVPVVGASAAISGHMAAAARFVFQAGGPLGVFRRHGARMHHVPALSLAASFRDRRVLVFLGLWFAINLLFGLEPGIVGEDAGIAWEAHLGGFLAGLVAFSAFDPGGGVRKARRHVPVTYGRDDDLPPAA